MNGLISIKNISLQPVSREILTLNTVSSEYGLVLTEKEAVELSDTRNKALSETDRLEMGFGAVEKIIKRFCTSHYINKEDYSYVLNEITYLFYYIKTETDDKISDDDLISELFTRFEISCQGSVDTLESREVERIIRKVNSGDHYYEWFADRDELDYDSKTGMRQASQDIIRDSYGENYFDDDSPADHDRYTDDDEYDYGDDDSFDSDPYDDFYDSERAYDPDSDERTHSVHEYDTDEDYDYLRDEDFDDE